MFDRTVASATRNPVKRIVWMFVIAIGPLGSSVPCKGATHMVNPSGTADFNQVQAAIDAAADGDTVLLQPGEYVVTESICFEGKAITVRGEAGPGKTVIRMSDTPPVSSRGTVFLFRRGEGRDSVLEGVTLTGGRGTHFDGTLQGGGVFISRSSPTIIGCRIVENIVDIGDANRTSFGGGIACQESSAEIRDCLIFSNSVRGGIVPRGGGISCLDSNVLLTRCEIVGNFAENGGGVYSGSVRSDIVSSISLVDCTISGNLASYDGGGVGIAGDSSADLEGCVLSTNYSLCAGGIDVESSSVTLRHCTLTGNTGERGGGGATLRDSQMTLTNCVVWNNNSGNDNGGAFRLRRDAVLETTYSSVEGDLLPGAGNINSDPGFCGWGAVDVVYVDERNAEPGTGTEADPYPTLNPALDYSLALSSTSPCIGTGENGVNMGAATGQCDAVGEPARLIHLGTGTYRMRGLSLFFNAGIEGVRPSETILEGTVFSPQDGPALSHVTVTGSTAGGIRIGSGSAPEIFDCHIVDNLNLHLNGGRGGGVYCSGASPTLKQCLISRNWSFVGGGIYSTDASNLKVLDCEISGNAAGLYGGGIFTLRTGGNVSLTNCQISGNWAQMEGGGAFLRGASVSLTNSSIWGNAAPEGGAMRVTFPDGISLTNCTMSGNAGTAGASVDLVTDLGDAEILLENTIVWGNFGTVVVGDEGVSHSSVETDELLPGAGNIHSDPLFAGAGVFDFNRFRTLTVRGSEQQLPDFVLEEPDLRLQSNSPAIDAGTSVGSPSTDLDGNARPCGAGFDMGAFEAGDCAPPVMFQRGDSNADGEKTIVDGIVTLNFLFLGATPPPCLDAADANDSGEIDIDDSLDIFNFLFLGGDTPPSLQSAKCGLDPTEDGLDCGAFSPCPSTE